MVSAGDTVVSTAGDRISMRGAESGMTSTSSAAGTSAMGPFTPAAFHS